jgi:hypothetical protein
MPAPQPHAGYTAWQGFVESDTSLLVSLSLGPWIVQHLARHLRMSGRPMIFQKSPSAAAARRNGQVDKDKNGFLVSLR